MAELSSQEYVPEHGGEDVFVQTAVDEGDIPTVYIQPQGDEEVLTACPNISEQIQHHKNLETKKPIMNSAHPESPSAGLPFPGQAKRRRKGKVHICEECGMSFAATSSYKRHLLIHSDLRPFECADCGRRFRSRTNLLQHILIHTKIKPHQCTFCGKSFSRSTHLKIHSCQRRCPAQNGALLAGSSVESEEDLILPDSDIQPQEEVVETVAVAALSEMPPTSPQTNAKLDSDDNPATCEICGAYFVKRSGLRRHKALSHRESESGTKDSFNCSVCKAKFAFLGLLEKHMRSHSVTMGFRCEECGETFEKRAAVECHIATHNLPAGSKKLSTSTSKVRTVSTGSVPPPSSPRLDITTIQIGAPISRQPHEGAVTERVYGKMRYPYECVACGGCFATVAQLSSHQAHECRRRLPNQPAARMQKCTRCRQQFSSPDDLLMHHCILPNQSAGRRGSHATVVHTSPYNVEVTQDSAAQSVKSPVASQGVLASSSSSSLRPAMTAKRERVITQSVHSTRSDAQDTLVDGRRLVTTTRTIMPEPPPLTSQTVKDGSRLSAKGQDQLPSNQRVTGKTTDLTPLTVIDSKGKPLKVYILPKSLATVGGKLEPPELLGGTSKRFGISPSTISSFSSAKSPSDGATGRSSVVVTSTLQRVSSSTSTSTTLQRMNSVTLTGSTSQRINSAMLSGSTSQRINSASSTGSTSHRMNSATLIPSTPQRINSATSTSSLRAPRLLQNTRYRCGECRFVTMDYKEYEKHVTVHRRDQQFACPYCPYSTRQLVSLERHQRTHGSGSMIATEHTPSAGVSQSNFLKATVDTLEIADTMYE